MMETLSDTLAGAQERQTGPTGALRFRSAEQIGVSFPKRTIELIVVPYGQEAYVPWDDGRMVFETIEAGAFDGIERRANRVRVNRDHDLTRTVGRAIAFHPSREEGLVAELRIAKTELGEETLALAADDCLDASAGYLPMPGGERWEGRSRCAVTKAFLGHIAMTPDPAYAEARVLAVRHKVAQEVSEATELTTPNLDQVKAWRLEQRYEELR
jgi:HK97 family phage prohead protease